MPSLPASSPANASHSQKPLERVAILDCGAQYTKVIDRRVRELKIATEIYPPDVEPEKLRGQVSAIILSGGPHSVYEEGAPQCHPGIFDLGIPVLGICYGMQVLNRHFGGTVEGGYSREYGETEIDIETDCILFKGLENKQHVLMSHGDSVTKLAPGFRVVGRSPQRGSTGGETLAAIADDTRRVYGLQFHPEVELSREGTKMLANFLYEVCKLEGTFTLEDRLETSLQEIRDTVGDNLVFVLVSGGVDSAVTAALLLRALGPDQVHAVHIDSGMMRLGESKLVMDALQSLGLKHLKMLEAEQDFLNGTTEKDGRTVGPLNQTTDPETKRQIIGDVFFHLINAEMQAILSEAGHAHKKVFLAQGTLRPDLIESGNRGISTSAHTIKTHHNDVDLIRQQREKGLVIEPNRDWHKDEVRQIGRLLGLPEALVARQPFPGPGLGIRVLCTSEPFGLDRYDAISKELRELAAHDGFGSLLLPVRSVGVQGDGRSYSFLGLLSVPNLPSLRDKAIWNQLIALAREIPNRISAINRVAVVLNHGSLPESVKAITPTYLNKPTLDILRRLDNLVTTSFDRDHCLNKFSQLLTVLIPAHTGNPDEAKHSVAIRGVITSDFMTARAARPGQDFPIDTLLRISDQLNNEPGIDLVVYDITSKPPATVEWE